jgi:hypothetical protein
MEVEIHCGRSMKVMCLNRLEAGLRVAKVRVRDSHSRPIPKFNRHYAKTNANLKNFVISRNLARRPFFNTVYIESFNIS